MTKKKQNTKISMHEQYLRRGIALLRCGVALRCDVALLKDPDPD